MPHLSLKLLIAAMAIISLGMRAALFGK